MSYPKQIPVDRNRSPMQDYPPAASAIGVWCPTNSINSSVVTFSDNTSIIEVAAVGGTGALRWLSANAANTSVIATGSTANFDHIIPQNTFRKFVVPKLSATVSSIVGINKKEGLFNQVAVISIGNASVLTTEY